MGEGSRLQLGDVGNNGTQEKKIIRKKTGNQNWQSPPQRSLGQGNYLSREPY